MMKSVRNCYTGKKEPGMMAALSNNLVTGHSLFIIGHSTYTTIFTTISFNNDASGVPASFTPTLLRL